MDNQLPIYTPAPASAIPSVFPVAPPKKSADLKEGDLVFNAERTHRLVSQPFGRILTFALNALSCTITIANILSLMPHGILSVLTFLGFCCLWYFFYSAYYEPEFLAGKPEFKKFYPVLAATVLFIITNLISVPLYSLEMAFELGFYFFATGFVYLMFMGDDYGSSCFLVCKPWRYRKLKNAISPY